MVGVCFTSSSIVEKCFDHRINLIKWYLLSTIYIPHFYLDFCFPTRSPREARSKSCHAETPVVRAIFFNNMNTLSEKKTLIEWIEYLSIKIPFLKHFLSMGQNTCHDIGLELGYFLRPNEWYIPITSQNAGYFGVINQYDVTWGQCIVENCHIADIYINIYFKHISFIIIFIFSLFHYFFIHLLFLNIFFLHFLL